MAFLVWAIHMLQKKLQKDAILKFYLEQIFKSFCFFRLFSVTRKYQVGIASNHKSSRCGENVSKLCTHCPSRFGNKFA